MLFNSHIFILAFLPLTLASFFLLGRLRASGPARLWLLAASLVFYGWWSWAYLALLLATMVLNWRATEVIRDARERDPARSRAVTILSIGVNLGLLGYFKYATFIAGNIGALTGLDLALEAVILPLAISFHTFQQIAYLVDVRRGLARRYALHDYLLFVTFFPQLIAGPIVHHHELLPQFERRETYRFQADAFAAGIAFFVIGLVKKLAIADPVSGLSTPVFLAADAGAEPAAFEAWLAVAAFSVGLYFDFSGYSDMAVGLARMFGIRLPYNFDSPYKATSIIDFWRRWHMTLSRFLRDYLYIPLGGSRRGPGRRHLNLLATMLLGGLWHGAAWTFVAWGALHGVYLLVNHAWNAHAGRVGRKTGRRPSLGAPVAQALTLLAVMVAWVFFAAPSFAAAASVLAGMAGANGLASPEMAALAMAALGGGIEGLREAVDGGLLRPALGALALGVLLILLAPNSQEIVDGHATEEAGGAQRRLWPRLRFGAAPALAAAAGFLLAFTLMANIKEFVYFQF
jgi:D-alanyl-lipoteichoic acid acyltransferase DltB (MBOAT superfamily)